MGLEEDRVQLEHRLTKVEEAVVLLPAMAEKIDHMEKKFERYEGRWGSILLMVTGLWAMFATFKDDILKLFTKG